MKDGVKFALNKLLLSYRVKFKSLKINNS